MKKIGNVGELINAVFPYLPETEIDLEIEGPIERSLMPWSGEIEFIPGNHPRKDRIILKVITSSELDEIEAARERKEKR